MSEFFFLSPRLPALDADLALALQAALPQPTEEMPPPGVVDRVRSRILQRIAAQATPLHTTVHPSADGWHPFSPGISRKVLHDGGDVMSYLLRLAPGAVLPAHRHPMDEECVVLEGVLCVKTESALEEVQELVLFPGSFHLGKKDVPHADITSNGGALIYLRGARPGAYLAI